LQGQTSELLGEQVMAAVSGVSLIGGSLRSIMDDQEIIFTVEDAPEGGYTARALGYAIFTQGETLEELRQMVRDAVNCHFEKENKPRLIRLHMVKDEVIVA
jgi:predicted RNase H-like HicB family nuclease